MWNLLLNTIFFYIDIEAPIMSNFEHFLNNTSLLYCIKYIFWTPAAGHLWFIRDLMLVSILSWPLYFCLRNNKWVVLVLLCFIALITHQCQTASLFSFAVGSYLSINRIDIQNLKGLIVYVALFLCLGELMIFMILRIESNAIPILSWGTAILLWVIYDKISLKSILNISRWRSLFFFIYLFHDPWLNIICTYTSKYLPNTFISNTCIFIGAQVLIIAITLLIAELLNKYNPKIYSIITGDRKH